LGLFAGLAEASRDPAPGAPGCAGDEGDLTTQAAAAGGTVSEEERVRDRVGMQCSCCGHVESLEDYLGRRGEVRVSSA